VTIPRGGLLAVFAGLWVGFLAVLYGLFASAQPANQYGPSVEDNLLLLLVATWPSGWIAKYAVDAFRAGVEWPTSEIGYVRLLWIVAGAVGFIQWFLVSPTLFGMALEGLTKRRTSLGLDDEEPPPS
jgi:hypothetical protein